MVELILMIHWFPVILEDRNEVCEKSMFLVKREWKNKMLQTSRPLWEITLLLSPVEQVDSDLYKDRSVIGASINVS